MTTQLERLSQDVNNLDRYIRKMQDSNNDSLVEKLNIKRRFLVKKLQSVEKQLQHENECLLTQ